MLVRRHNHAAPGAGIDVDVRIHAALADQSELVQTIEQRSLDLRPLANENQCLSVFQTPGKRVGVLHMVIPDFDLMRIQLPETRKGPQCVEVVVENRDLQLTNLLRSTGLDAIKSKKTTETVTRRREIIRRMRIEKSAGNGARSRPGIRSS